MLFTKEDCIKVDNPLYLGDGVAVLDVKNCLKEQYHDAKYQLVTCGGFAADPNTIAAARGSGVFIDWCIDDDHSRHERGDFIGIAKPEAVKMWLKLYGDEIQHWTEESTKNMKQYLEDYSNKTEQELIDMQNSHWTKKEEAV